MFGNRENGWLKCGVFLSVLLPLVACSKTRAELEECRARNVALGAENSRLDQDIKDLRTDYKEVLRSFAVPSTEGGSLIESFREDVQSRIDVVSQSVEKDVPPLVKEQLQQELDSLLTLLDRQFGEMDVQYTKIGSRLYEVRGALDLANERLEGLELTGIDIQQELSSQRVLEERLEREVESVASLIEEFDETRFLCRDCEEYLRLKRKRQDVVVAFHSELRSALRRLPTALMRPDQPVDDGGEAGSEPRGPDSEGQ